jgi:carbonic anhydrase
MNRLLALIEPGLPKSLPGDNTEQQVNAAVEANVHWSIKQLAGIPEAKKAIEAGRFSLLGAIYELATGRVRFLST